MSEKLFALTSAMYDFQKTKNQFFNRVRETIEAGSDKDFEVIGKKLENNESVMAAIVKRELDNVPIYNEFFIPIKGLSTYMSASIISSIKDIKRFQTVSKLWAYSGLHVIDGKAVKRKAGEKCNWNGFLKSKLRVAADCLMKLNFDADHQPLRYRKFYDDYKNRRENVVACHLTKEEHAKSKDSKATWLPNGCTKGHIHNMSLRYIEKMLLQDLWLKWWELEGGAPTRPYAEAILGRVHGEYPKD